MTEHDKKAISNGLESADEKFYLEGDVRVEGNWDILAKWSLAKFASLFLALIIDPPYRYKGFRPKYPTMSLDEIFSMPLWKVQLIGWLFLWVPCSIVDIMMKFLEQQGY